MVSRIKIVCCALRIRSALEYISTAIETSLCNPRDHCTHSLLQDCCIVKLITSNRQTFLHRGTAPWRWTVLYALVRKTMHGVIVGKRVRTRRLSDRYCTRFWMSGMFWCDQQDYATVLERRVRTKSRDYTGWKRLLSRNKSIQARNTALLSRLNIFYRETISSALASALLSLMAFHKYVRDSNASLYRDKATKHIAGRYIRWPFKYIYICIYIYIWAFILVFVIKIIYIKVILYFYLKKKDIRSWIFESKMH